MHKYCHVQGAIVSVFSIGALVGALLSGLLSDLAGRKVTLILGGSLFAFGGALQTFSFFLWSVGFIYSTKDVLTYAPHGQKINIVSLDRYFCINFVK